MNKSMSTRELKVCSETNGRKKKGEKDLDLG